MPRDQDRERGERRPCDQECAHTGPARKFNLDEILPPRSVGEWPEGLSLRREDMYEDRA